MLDSETLTARNRDIVRRVRAGKTRREIARETGLNYKWITIILKRYEHATGARLPRDVHGSPCRPLTERDCVIVNEYRRLESVRKVAAQRGVSHGIVRGAILRYERATGEIIPRTMKQEAWLAERAT